MSAVHCLTQVTNNPRKRENLFLRFVLLIDADMFVQSSPVLLEFPHGKHVLRVVVSPVIGRENGVRRRKKISSGTRDMSTAFIHVIKNL